MTNVVHDSCTDLFMSQTGAFDRDVRVLRVQQEAFVKHVGKVLIRAFCETSRSEVVNP